MSLPSKRPEFETETDRINLSIIGHALVKATGWWLEALPRFYGINWVAHAGSPHHSPLVAFVEGRARNYEHTTVMVGLHKAMRLAEVAAMTGVPAYLAVLWGVPSHDPTLTEPDVRIARISVAVIREVVCWGGRGKGSMRDWQDVEPVVLLGLQHFVGLNEFGEQVKAAQQRGAK